MYEWVTTQQCNGQTLWTMYHNSRIQITLTKYDEYRVWDTREANTVGIYITLSRAKKAAENYYQIEC